MVLTDAASFKQDIDLLIEGLQLAAQRQRPRCGRNWLS
jgi:hypothetical protein